MSRQASDKVLVYLALLLCPVLSDHLNEPDLCAEEPADSNCYCGAPAEPEGVDIYYALNDTRYDHNHSDHNIHKSRIVYKCHNRYDLLVGNDMRKCHRGKWLGQVPRCEEKLATPGINLSQYLPRRQVVEKAMNLLREVRLKSIDMINWSDNPMSTIGLNTHYYNTFGAFTPPLRLQPAICPRLSSNGPHLWRLNLDREVSVHYLQMKFHSKNIRKYWLKNEFQIRIYMINTKNISTWINCSYNDDPVGNKSRKSYRNNNNNKNAINNDYLNLEYYCENDQVNLTYNSIHLEFEAAKKKLQMDWISLCDLRLYRFNDSCGEPDYPVTLQVQKSLQIPKRYDFFCFTNDYVLDVPGKNYILCGSNGKWLDEVPICVPSSFCRGFPNNTFSNDTIVEYEKDSEWANGEYGPLFQNGTTARLTCKNHVPEAGQSYQSVICERGRWRVHESHGMTECNTKKDMLSTNQKLIRVLAVVLIVCLLIIFLLIFNMIKCRRRRRDNAMTEYKNSRPNDYDLEFYESEVKYEEISETYDKVPQIYYNCFDGSGNHLHLNPIFSDDVSDQGLEFQKTNSIYSNLSNL